MTDNEKRTRDGSKTKLAVATRLANIQALIEAAYEKCSHWDEKMAASLMEAQKAVTVAYEILLFKPNDWVIPRRAAAGKKASVLEVGSTVALKPKVSGYPDDLTGKVLTIAALPKEGLALIVINGITYCVQTKHLDLAKVA